MNIALLCVLIIITDETDGFPVENIGAPFEEKTGEKIPPRKLESLERDGPIESKTATWNQILADALVNRIKVFSFNKVTESERATDVGFTNNILTHCIGQMMRLYKTLIYDKIYKRNDTPNVKSYDTELNKEYKHSLDENVLVDFPYPKDEVEIIEPKYHGKMCDDCKGRETDAPKNETSGIEETVQIAQTTVTDCPTGLVANDGGCAEPKSKFILSIPYQCPIGYKRDWLGYCRPQL